MTLLDRHISFIEALRSAGMQVSLAEDLDSVRAMTELGLGDREQLRAALAATLMKKSGLRSSFDAIFDLFYPPMLGTVPPAADEERTPVGELTVVQRDALVHDLRQQITDALLAEDQQRISELARDAVEQFGAMPGRAPGMSAWSSYSTLQRLNPDILVMRLTKALVQGVDGHEPRSAEASTPTAQRRVNGFKRAVETEVHRRLAEGKGAESVAQTTLRPSIEQIPFTSARADELDEMRRQIYPLARRLAVRLTKEQHHRRRGPLDFRRTVRASISTGGVPLTLYNKPKRPHRNELVVLCDVSGSVANFANFTLLFVYALREQFGKVRAFTFVDDIHEVSDEFVPGADPAEVLKRLAESSRKASTWGRTNYGRAFKHFAEQHPDVIGPRTALLILGDARSNYGDPGVAYLADMVDMARHAWWLNPEHFRQWGTGDSATPDYMALVPMVECRNLVQLTEFVHDVL